LFIIERPSKSHKSNKYTDRKHDNVESKRKKADKYRYDMTFMSISKNKTKSYTVFYFFT